MTLTVTVEAETLEDLQALLIHVAKVIAPKGKDFGATYLGAFDSSVTVRFSDPSRLS